MEKTDVDIATLTNEELERLAKGFGIEDLDRTPEKLCGGYSSVNYAVVAQRGSARALLRVAVGLPDEVAQRQARVLRAAAAMGVQCPGTRRAPSGDYVLCCATSDGKRACATVLGWVDGKTANKLAAEGDEAGMLAHLGRLLATLHAAPQPAEDLGLHAVSSDIYLQCFMHWPAGTDLRAGLRETEEVAGGSSVVAEFLRPRWAASVTALAGEGLPQGLLHGDPFLDNMMVGSAGATLLDWDEAATGPFAYDLATAIVGGCFSETGELKEARLRALLQAYVRVRPLAAVERSALPELMKANALWVAWYRWRAFHIEVADAPADARESYKEMINIYACLEQGPAGEKIAAVLRELTDGSGPDDGPSAKKRPSEDEGGVAKKPAVA